MPLTERFPLATDCSGFVTLCYFLGGAPDPNGLGFNGSGYTGTLLSWGKHIPLSSVRPGDAIVYGPGSGWHTALIVEGGADPLTISLGEQGDPSLVRVSQDGRLPQTYLRFDTRSPHPTPPPSPAPTPHPTLEQLDSLGFVVLHNPTEARLALTNGWPLYVWDGVSLVLPKGKLPKGTPEYANAHFAVRRPV